MFCATSIVNRCPLHSNAAEFGNQLALATKCNAHCRSSHQFTGKDRAVRVVCAAVVDQTAVLKRVVKNGKVATAERQLLAAISNVKGRGASGFSPEQQDQLEEAVKLLERDGGLVGPTANPTIFGRWRLLFTTRPGSASPIQRTFTGVDAFSVFQEIEVEEEGSVRVTNVVDFGPAIGFLRVEAEASTDSRPIPGFVPRQGAGLAVFGKSNVYPPAKEDMRIDFQFDQAAFTFKFLPFKLPYPVPFKLLGDETKGWIDITYLSRDGTLRLTRGNKGTLFVLVKDEPPRDKLLRALEQGEQDEGTLLQLIQQLQQTGDGKITADRSPATSERAVGKWRLRWSLQADNANPLQKSLSGNVKSFQIIGGEAGEGKLENLVEFLPFLKLRAVAECEAVSATRTQVDSQEVSVELGPFKIPLKSVVTDGVGYLDWLYLDDDLRVTRGNKGSLFIHTKQ